MVATAVQSTLSSKISPISHRMIISASEPKTTDKTEFPKELKRFFFIQSMGP